MFLIPERRIMIFFLLEPIIQVQRKLHVNFQIPSQSGSARLLGISIFSFKEAMGTFLTPDRRNMIFFLLKPFIQVLMKLYVNFQIPRESGSARLLGVSIHSFKEAKGTFLTPFRGNMNFFLHKSFSMVQIKHYLKFQSCSWSGRSPSPWCLHSFLQGS